MREVLEVLLQQVRGPAKCARVDSGAFAEGPRTAAFSKGHRTVAASLSDVFWKVEVLECFGVVHG